MDAYDCANRPSLWFIKNRCNGARDCLPNDELRPGTWHEMVCDALNWNAPDERRFTEIWTRDNQHRILRISGRFATADRLGRCGIAGAPRDYPGAQADPDRFTVNVPGLSDVLRIPQLESKQLRYQRYIRMRDSKSALPSGLKWLPPVLNALDDAQDLLFTAIALAYPVARWLGLRFVPLLGAALTVNDLLNVFT